MFASGPLNPFHYLSAVGLTALSGKSHRQSMNFKWSFNLAPETSECACSNIHHPPLEVKLLCAPVCPYIHAESNHQLSIPSLVVRSSKFQINKGWLFSSWKDWRMPWERGLIDGVVHYLMKHLVIALLSYLKDNDNDEGTNMKLHI